MAYELPQFLGPDGVYRSTFLYTTTLSSRFFTGRVDPATVDMQVSIRGAAFTSNPDLIAFGGGQFIIPNPAASSNGLGLLQGANNIQVRAVLPDGTVTAPAVIQATLSVDRDLGIIFTPPSGISIERFDHTVKITVAGLTSPNVAGYNFYASTEPGGGQIGYTQINPTLVQSGTTTEVVTSIGSLTADARVATLPPGTSTGVFAGVSGSQYLQDGTILQVDFTEVVEVPPSETHLRTTVDVSAVATVTNYAFTHDRLATFNSPDNPALPKSTFNQIAQTDPLYYAVTAVYMAGGTEYESFLSPEVSGAPLIVTPTIGGFPAVGRQQIVRDMVLSVFRSQPQVSLTPGSVAMDTGIDPFASESERVRFVVDFLHNAKAFPTLLLLDDPGYTGTSIAVSQSPYKLALRQAFFLKDADSVQTLIDNCFDLLASNYGKTRLAGRRARGEVTFYLNQRPASTVLLPIGTRLSGGGQYFRTTELVRITPNGAGSYYNPVTGRYSATAFIQAESPGTPGIVGPNQISTVINGPAGVSVTNPAPTFGGTDAESNFALAERAMGALSSVDTGTLQGYTQMAVNIAAVEQVNVVEAGHPLMHRDLNPETGLHTGGKVDVWFRGSNLVKVTDTFAFSFEIVKGIQFELIGNPQDLKFRAVDPNLSVDNPIIELLDFPVFGYEFRNTTRGVNFDLTDATILSYNSVQLSNTYNDPAGFSITDVVVGAYRYRTGSKFVFTRQPVSKIYSFQGDPTRSGTIDTTAYALYHPSSPLVFGRSKLAGDYLQVVQPISGPVVQIPSGDPVEVSGESHVLLDGIEYLGSLGANPLTIRVFNADRSVEYVGPYNPLYASGTPLDFNLVSGSSTTPWGISLASGSAISNGQAVLLDYYHDENFVVTYQTNSLVGITQEALDAERHACADVLAKEAVEVPVDLSATIVLKPRANATQASADVRTALARMFSTLNLGQPRRASDIDSEIRSVESVSYVVLPLTKFTRSDGAPVIEESVLTDQTADYAQINAWSSATKTVFLLTNPLRAATTDGGGPVNEFRAVQADILPLTLFNAPPNINGTPFKLTANAAFIIGKAGLTIPGYSDKTTLQQKYPFATDQELVVRMAEITGNRVLVCLPAGQTPAANRYTVTYVVSGDTGVRNIEPGPTEYLTLGNLDFTFDEDVDYLAPVQGRRSI